ncbi:MAG: crossover junction endodeoxyribonuclease RuvC [Clostridia bacterium]
MIILGIDPGFGRIGYGIISYNKNQYKVMEYGCITTPENSYFPKRLNKIEQDLEVVLSRYEKIDAASIEDLYFNTNITTAIKVAQARGVILNTLSKHNIDIYEYTPIQAKQAIAGYGRASKHQVMEMLKKVLKMENMPKLDDTADALALAICHTQYNRYTEFTGTDKSKKGTMTKLQEVYEEEAKKDKEIKKKRDIMIKKAIEKERNSKIK